MTLREALKVGAGSNVTLKDGRKAVMVSKTWAAGTVTFVLRDHHGATYTAEHGEIK